MQHHFNVEIAKKFGINVAIFLDHMAFWINKNVANNSHFHDGTYWTYNTVEAYTEIFPYWTTKQMRKVLSDCEKYGLINTGNYNEKKYDSKKWYSLTEYAAKLLNLTICPPGQMQLPKRANAIAQKGKPIAYALAVTNTSREPERKKRVPLSDDFKPNAEAEKLAREKGLDIAKVFFKFRHNAKSKGLTLIDWDSAFLKWISDEKKIEINPQKITNNEIRSTVPWFGDNH